MKKLVLLIALFASVLTFAQETKESKFNPYVAAGISIGDSSGDTFANTSYFSAEVGVMYENLAFGAVIGAQSFSSANSLSSYYYEGKIAVYKSLGYVDGYGVLGVGSYFGEGTVFLEYGLGISKEFNDFGLFIQVSNWDGVTYITPGISFSL